MSDCRVTEQFKSVESGRARNDELHAHLVKTQNQAEQEGYSNAVQQQEQRAKREIQPVILFVIAPNLRRALQIKMRAFARATVAAVAASNLCTVKELEHFGHQLNMKSEHDIQRHEI
jgi:hypothetical protein